ncbi:hypothetical protein [Nonomuraea jiangxiensis]|uniref:Uncharacterized protein n=1 Tax=Nonomuraea jiangxiensis TaxID=633440 RepID=A0A1G8QEN4_9ACTN|nr:hypothetical protein [Nonomuraea jiangxiensis]SDJ03088.1 hypothetical protein SAMN05421869_108217 [Nonomuraea jiangxiensis]
MWDIRNGEDFVEDWRDADSAEWRYLHESAATFNAAQDDLVAVPAIENTWYDGTGDINVFNTDWHVTARATEKGSVDGFGNAFGTGDMKYDGIVGYSCGVLRDALSAADVSTGSGRYAGGLVGIAGGATQRAATTGGSLTERAYAAGPVKATGNQSAGGISGYAYTGTTVRNNVALNPTVTATGWAHRIVARTLADGAPAVGNNLASELVVAATQNVGATAPESFNGTTITAAQAVDPATYTALGWDLETVWRWDTGLGRPVLRGPAAPAAAVLSPAGAGGIRHEAVANGDGTVTLAVSAGSAAADRQLSVLLLRGRSSTSAPDEDDIAYLGEVRLDGQGDATLTVLVPEPGKPALALNTSGDTTRYTASLLPKEPPTGTPAMTVLDDTVTATAKPHGNAPAQVTITLVCAGEATCQDQVVISHGGGAQLDARKVTLQPGRTRDLKVDLAGR